MHWMQPQIDELAREAGEHLRIFNNSVEVAGGRECLRQVKLDCESVPGSGHGKDGR